MTAMTSDALPAGTSGAETSTAILVQHATAEWSYGDLLARLKSFQQQHVLQFWDELSPDERHELAMQVEAIDLAQIQRLYETRHDDHADAFDPAQVDGPPAYRLGVGNDPKRDELARSIGAAMLGAGTVGVVIVAGGQGSRLGFSNPKGMYPIGPISGATLFQMLFERVIATSRKFGIRIPVYLMTSPATHEQTVQFLHAHANFGLADEDLFIFCQGVMPAVDEQGRLLLSEKGQLFLSPNGHGGMLEALRRSRALEDMQRRGIEHLFYQQIHNPLVDLIDPKFIGYHVLSNSDVTTQVIPKQGPFDKAGNVVAIDGKVRIIEYSDLPDDLACQRRGDGSLKLWAGNIAVHCFSVAFFEQVAEGAISLPFHYAHKKVPFLNDAGAVVEPESPNATKFEQFIFDLLPAARRAIVVEVDPVDVYGPVKNAPGSGQYSPEHVQELMMGRYRRWLRAASVDVAEHTRVEISPLFANSAQELRDKFSQRSALTRDAYLK